MEFTNQERAIYEPGKENNDNPPKPIKILNDRNTLSEENIEERMGVFDEEVNIVQDETENTIIDNSEVTGVVLLSGGLDSVGALAWAINNNIRVHALIIDYGASNNKREIKSAKKIARHYNVPFQVVKIDMPMWDRGLMNQNPDIYCDTINKDEKETVGGEYVPARNTIFLAYAYAYAESLNLDSIIVGFNIGNEKDSFNGFGYMPDTSPVFCRAFQYVINTSTARDKYTIALIAPFLRATKSEIVEYCMRNNVPVEDSYSCFKGEEDACGVCRTCVSRLDAFADAGFEDPAPYQNREYYKKLREE